MKNDKLSLQKENFRDFTEVQAADDYTVIITTEQPVAVMLDRLQNRFILSKIRHGSPRRSAPSLSPSAPVRTNFRAGSATAIW